MTSAQIFTRHIFILDQKLNLISQCPQSHSTVSVVQVTFPCTCTFIPQQCEVAEGEDGVPAFCITVPRSEASGVVNNKKETFSFKYVHCLLYEAVAPPLTLPPFFW